MDHYRVLSSKTKDLAHEVFCFTTDNRLLPLAAVPEPVPDMLDMEFKALPLPSHKFYSGVMFLLKFSTKFCRGELRTHFPVIGTSFAFNAITYGRSSGV